MENMNYFISSKIKLAVNLVRFNVNVDGEAVVISVQRVNYNYNIDIS